MKKDSTGISSETYKKHLDFQRIGNLAVRKAQAENRRPGLPNVYSRNGKIIFEMANGELILKKANEK
jgi:hypothetical protein